MANDQKPLFRKKIITIGNSLGIVLDADIQDLLGSQIEKGDYIEFVIEGIRKVKSKESKVSDSQPTKTLKTEASDRPLGSAPVALRSKRSCAKSQTTSQLQFESHKPEIDIKGILEREIGYSRTWKFRKSVQIEEGIEAEAFIEFSLDDGVPQ